MNKHRLAFIRTCFYIGFVVDLLATFPLVFPEIAKLMFGLQNVTFDIDYLYVSRIGASLMLGWTVLLLWGSFKPIERSGILLITVFPVLIGLLISSILAVSSGFIEIKHILPLWIFYALIIPLFTIAYVYSRKKNEEE